MQSTMPLRQGYPEVTKTTTRGVFKFKVTSKFEIGGGKPLEVRNKEVKIENRGKRLSLSIGKGSIRPNPSHIRSFE